MKVHNNAISNKQNSIAQIVASALGSSDMVVSTV